MKNSTQPFFAFSCLRAFIFCLILFSSLHALHCQTTIDAGDVSGTWTFSGSPYIVTGSITVESGKSLIIKPGVIVRFSSGAYLNCYDAASIVALGTKDSSIRFTSNQGQPSPGDWGGIGIIGTNRKCTFRHVVIEYASYGISFRAYASGCNATSNYGRIDSSIIRNNGTHGISIVAGGSSYSGCTFPKNGVSSPEIFDNAIYSNQVGISIDSYTGFLSGGYVGASIQHNLMYDNSNNAIACYGDDSAEPKIINNTIVENGADGIYYQSTFDSIDFEIINNIITSNGKGINSNNNQRANIKYNDVWGNQSDYSGINTPVSDISKDPLFKDLPGRDFRLTSPSPCIDAGDPEMEDPDGTVSDIGALYFAQPPKADFSGDKTQGTYPLNVNFTDKSTGTVNSWLWDFGDNQTSAEKSPGHTYTQAGKYTVSLTITGPGGSDVETKVDYITVTVPKPVAGFTANPVKGSVPLTVSFTDQSTGIISDWAWDFGEGSTSTEQHPEHTFADTGSFTITLTVTGPGGADTKIKNDYIIVLVPPPVAAFTANPLSGDLPFVVDFSDNSTGDISLWGWDFGDGNHSTESSPQHTYTLDGLYDVTLIVTGKGGSDTLIQPDLILVTHISDISDYKDKSGVLLYPNPCISECQVEFFLDKSARVTITAYDGLGRLVRHLYHGSLPAGHQQVTLSLSGFPNGSVYVAIEKGSQRTVKKVVVQGVQRWREE
jgi:parallel beta-helix repeat protein